MQPFVANSENNSNCQPAAVRSLRCFVQTQFVNAEKVVRLVASGFFTKKYTFFDFLKIF